MKYFIPNPTLTQISDESIADDLNNHIELVEWLVEEIKPSDITRAIGQEYVDKLTALTNEMVDESEEEFVEHRNDLANAIIVKYFLR